MPGVGDAPLYVAWQRGLFKQRGLTVHLRSYKTMGEVMTALHSGQANVAVGDYADFFYEQERDSSAPMVVLADGYDAAPNIMDVLVSPDSPITGPQGLQGKTIGTAAPQVMPDNVGGHAVQHGDRGRLLGAGERRRPADLGEVAPHASE